MFIAITPHPTANAATFPSQGKALPCLWLLLRGEQHGVLSTVFGFPLEVSNTECCSIAKHSFAQRRKRSCHGVTDEVVFS